MEEPADEGETLEEFEAELRRYREWKARMTAKYGLAWREQYYRRCREKLKREGVKFIESEDDPMHPRNVARRQIEAGAIPWKSTYAPPPDTPE
jgi:hypothetical protein